MTSRNYTFNLLNSCNQRSLQAKYNIPPPRLDAKTYPSGFSVDQLSMRRKAEILKYSSNKQSTQTNSLTKAEQWAKLVKQPKVNANENRLNACPKDRMILTPTSSCDVPGPIVYLYDDETVPLYNYAVKTDAFSILPVNSPNRPYDVKKETNVALYDGVETTIAYVIMRNPKQIYYLIDFSTPIKFYFQCSNLNPNSSYNVSFTLSPYLNIYYSADLICSNSQNILQNTIPIVDVSDLTDSFDIPSSSIKNNSYNLQTQIGSIKMSNITLPSSYGNVYKISITFNIDFSFTGNNSSGNEYYSYYFLA